MKTRTSIILIGLALFLSSCIVKSIQPFYTAESQYFDDRLVGDFITKGKSTWKFLAFKTEWEKENQDKSKLTKEDYEEFEQYKNAYYVEYISKGDEAYFIAMPFKVGEHLFLNFSPLYYDENDVNGMYAQHLLKTHSAAKVDFNKDDTIILSWISESVIKRLFNEQKIRLKHETVGVNEDLVLTASSEELHSFLKKFMSSEIENKWNKDDIVTLNPHDAKP
ncbi:hypothetical protein [Winogradskyella sp.]|uniref:hypothetical protein n=1 Tax=Winogradskyella sp. TaxID=1883156 RepID=UPI00262441F0|nr:hypothetical protein [Winogradskyella sp.]